MSLSKDDLVSGLREGLQTKSRVNEATMPLTSMVEYIDVNVLNKAQEIKDLIAGSMAVDSMVSKTPSTVKDLVAWIDWHLNNTIPNRISLAAPYDTIRDKRTGAVYMWRAGDRPVFRHITDGDQWQFLLACRLVSSSAVTVDAEGNLVEFLWGQLKDLASDTSLMQAIIPPPPPATYTVAKGDTFGAIATKLGITVDALKAANPQVKDVNVINVGDVLNVPK